MSKEVESGLPSLALVFGYIAVKELKSSEDKIAVLSRLGYSNPDIALICDTTPGSVKVIKSNINKNKRKKNYGKRKN